MDPIREPALALSLPPAARFLADPSVYVIDPLFISVSVPSEDVSPLPELSDRLASD